MERKWLGPFMAVLFVTAFIAVMITSSSGEWHPQGKGEWISFESMRAQGIVPQPVKEDMYLRLHDDSHVKMNVALRWIPLNPPFYMRGYFEENGDFIPEYLWEPRD